MENPSRPWREIARELASEPNNKRAWELSQELDKALTEQGIAQRKAKAPALYEKLEEIKAEKILFSEWVVVDEVGKATSIYGEIALV